MNKDKRWLEELLLKERSDVLNLLDHNHKALIAAFETKYPSHNRQPSFDIDDCVVSLTEAQTVQQLSPDNHDRLADSPEDAFLSVEVRQSLPHSLKRRRRGSQHDATAALIRSFDEIDKDRSGKLTLDEFREALQSVGLNASRARKMVKRIEVLSKGADAVLTGEIERDDWMHLVCGESVCKLDSEILSLADKLNKRAVDEALLGKRYTLMLSSLSTARLMWDCLTAICTIYVVTLVPLWLGFGTELLTLNKRDIEAFAKVEHFIDVVFLLDILLNFRTTYFTRLGHEVKCWRRVAVHYLGSWFIVDACSSIPVSFITQESNADMKSLKLIKFTRFFAILKLLRTARVFNMLEGTVVGEYIDEKVIEYKLNTHMRIVKIVLVLFACCHWLACAMAACGRAFIQDLIAGAEDFADVYIPAFYWAMTTCTTVGYGDITPKNTGERIVAMVAMCCGGTFYGVVSGTFGSIIGSYDKVSQERIAQMEVVNAWLQKNNFPRRLKRKIHFYYKSLGTAKTCTKDEMAIIEDLTSPLLTEVAKVLLPEEVRLQPIFECVPGFVIGFLVSTLQVVSFKAEDVIIRTGDYGDAMYIVKKGHCEKQVLVDPNNTDASSVRKIQLYISESFGEEFVLDLDASCSYTILAIKTTEFYCITKQHFQSGMENHPEHLVSMRNCFQSTLENGAQLV